MNENCKKHNSKIMVRTATEKNRLPAKNEIKKKTF